MMPVGGSCLTKILVGSHIFAFCMGIIILGLSGGTIDKYGKQLSSSNLKPLYDLAAIDVFTALLILTGAALGAATAILKHAKLHLVNLSVCAFLALFTFICGIATMVVAVEKKKSIGKMSEVICMELNKLTNRGCTDGYTDLMTPCGALLFIMGLAYCGFFGGAFIQFKRSKSDSGDTTVTTDMQMKNETSPRQEAF